MMDRIAGWLGIQRASTNPIDYQVGGIMDFGPGIGNQPSHARLLQESRGIADTATRAIANRVSTLNPLVKIRRKQRDGTTVDEILDDHPLKVLLDRPHPDMTRAQLFRLWAQWIVTVGEGYALKVGSGLNMPVELQAIPPTNIYPIIKGGVVDSYVTTSGKGKVSTLASDLVIRFFFPDPENIWGSEGYLGPEAITADSLKFSGEHLRRRYEKDATPKTALETGTESSPFSLEEKKRFRSEWTKQYSTRYGKSTDAPAILPVGYKLVEMMMQSGADIVPLLEYWRDEQLMGFGTPRSILGQSESGDRSTAETNQYVFDRHAVKPVANLIADGLTLQLAPDFDAGIFVEFEEFVSDDKAFNLQQETADLTGMVRSINQVREDRALDPVDWGEQPVSKFGQVPYEPDEMGEEFQPDVPSALGVEESEPEPDRVRIRTELADMEWVRQIAREKKFVPELLRATRSVLKDQLKLVLQALEAQRARALSAKDLIDEKEWKRLFKVKVEPVRVEAFESVMTETLVGLGGEAEFVFTSSMQKMLAKQGAQLVTNTTKTTKKRLTKLLQKSAAKGDSVDSIARKIRSTFKTRIQTDARTIARTEILKSTQSAQLEAFDVMEIDGKQWHTAQDGDVRDSHAYAEGQIALQGDSFDLAGEAADAPGVGAGGGALSAANSINCRCFLTPVREIEQ